MKHDDTLDPARWRAFLWRREIPPSVPPAPAALPVEDETRVQAPPPPRAAPEQSDATRERFARYANRVEEVWRMPLGEARREAALDITKKLLGSFRSAQMNAVSPRAATRLLRLAVWIWPTLSESEQSARQEGVLFAVFDHPEKADLLVEAALLGDRRFAAWLRDRLPAADLHRELPNLGRALVRVIEEAHTWDTRAIALAWLVRGDWTEAVECVRKALRWPHLGARVDALEHLLARPGRLCAEDVAWLLDDAVVHPIDRDTDWENDLLGRYENALAEAVAKCPPPDGHRALERIARGGYVFINGEREVLDDEWALRVLAAVWPERSLVDLDRWMRKDLAYFRRRALGPLEVLDERFARPRLLAFAVDAAPDIAQRARALWTKRFASLCPVDPFAGVSLRILDAEPSASFESRVRVLRNTDDAARAKMLRALYEAPPTRETLALVLFGLRTFYEHAKIEGLPETSENIFEALRAKHGDLALDASLDDLACCPVGSRWPLVLCILAREGKLDADRRERYAAILTELVKVDPGEPDSSVLTGLEMVRPTDEAVEVLKAMALSDDLPRHQGSIRHALIARGPDPSLDAWIVETFRAARAAGQWSRVEAVGSLALRRDVTAIIPVIEGDILNLDLPEAHDALDALVQPWGKRGVSEAQVLDALSDPARIRFVRLARLAPSEGAAGEVATALLFAALDSDAFGGRACGTALAQLLRSRAMDPDDPRADAVYARASLDMQQELFSIRTYLWIGDLTHLLPSLRALLVHPDEAVAVDAFELWSFKYKQVTPDEWVRAVLPEVCNAKVCDYLREDLGDPTEAELYWVDADD